MDSERCYTLIFELKYQTKYTDINSRLNLDHLFVCFYVFRLLHQSGGHIGSITSELSAEICTAASSNDVALLEAWHLAGVELNVRNATGRTPLHEAVCALCKEAVDYLLSLGINSGIKDNLGKSALENALELEHVLTSGKQGNDKEMIIIHAIIHSLKKPRGF